jgi:putative transcriptional regulator
MIGLLDLCNYHASMIRFKLQQRLADFAFREQRRITLDEVATATGIHRTTLSRLNAPTGANVTTDNLDRLCHYLHCDLHDLVEYLPSAPPEPRKKAKRTDDLASNDAEPTE